MAKAGAEGDGDGEAPARGSSPLLGGESEAEGGVWTDDEAEMVEAGSEDIAAELGTAVLEWTAGVEVVEEDGAVNMCVD